MDRNIVSSGHELGTYAQHAIAAATPKAATHVRLNPSKVVKAIDLQSPIPVLVMIEQIEYFK